MTLNQRKKAFVRIGELFKVLVSSADGSPQHSNFDPVVIERFNDLIRAERSHNGWFTSESVYKSIQAWSELLTEEKLNAWLSEYELPERQDGPKRIGLILAGNIPLVGFHDLLCTVLSGHIAVMKLSRDDNRLLPTILNVIADEFPDLKAHFEYAPMKLERADAVIATGSNNTARHFEYYFRNIPKVIRHNRTSVAVLIGEETEEELHALGHDIFDYFGLGCRNVTKLYLSKSFDLDRFFTAIFPFQEIVNHNKYANNYDYHKALWLLNRDELIENGFILVKEDSALVSPVGSIFIQRYENISEVNAELASKQNELQCVVGRNHLPFGKAQHPELNDYADGVDTIAFLLSLNH